MMRTFLSSFILCCAVCAYGQPTGGNVHISRERAIEIASRKHFFKTGKVWNEPGAELDVKYNHWIVFSQMSVHSDRGNCRKTNGCTIVKTREIVIDAETGKVLDKRRTKDTYPNYE